MRACLRCLTLVDTDVLLVLYVPAVIMLLHCGWLWCRCYCCPCAAATAALVLLLLLPLCTKKLKKHTRRENENTEVQKSVESEEKLERSSK